MLPEVFDDPDDPLLRLRRITLFDIALFSMTPEPFNVRAVWKCVHHHCLGSCHTRTMTGHADPGTDTGRELMAGGGRVYQRHYRGPMSLSSICIENLVQLPASACEDVSRITTRVDEEKAVKEENAPIAP